MLEIIAAAEADVAKLPQGVQIWINAIGPLLLTGIICLFINRKTRVLGLVSVALEFLGIVGVYFIHSKMGLVRLIGLGHIPFWLPLLMIYIRRLRNDPPQGIAKYAIIGLSVVLAISLIFDITDVIRWVAGERGSIV